MQKLYFVTTNAGKVTSLQNHLEKLDVEVMQVPLDLIEPQADDVKGVSLVKAKQAFKILKKPLIVDDSAFVIDELNGFPGPYIKFVLKTVGIEKLVRFVDQLASRGCRFESCLTFISRDGQPSQFSGQSEKATLAKKVDEGKNNEMWSDLWRVVIPKYAKKTLVSMTYEERKALHEKHKLITCYDEFIFWFSKRRVYEHS